MDDARIFFNHRNHLAGSDHKFELVGIKAKQVKDGGEEVVFSDGVFDRFVAEVVGAAVSQAPFDTSAGEPECEAFSIVIATC